MSHMFGIDGKPVDTLESSEAEVRERQLRNLMSAGVERPREGVSEAATPEQLERRIRNLEAAGIDGRPTDRIEAAVLSSIVSRTPEQRAELAARAKELGMKVEEVVAAEMLGTRPELYASAKDAGNVDEFLAGRDRVARQDAIDAEARRQLEVEQAKRRMQRDSA